jgi:hypothetical protein
MREMCSDYLINCMGVEGMRAARYANRWVGMTVEVSTDKEGKKANTSLEKEEMLRHESFPRNYHDRYYKLPPVGSTHTGIPEHAVERALFSVSVQNAPGQHKLSFGAIWLLWEWDKERIVRLTGVEIATGRHPVVWKQTSGVVICKPGKDDYTKLKASRSISQLRSMWKVVQNVAAELLLVEATTRGPLSGRQFWNSNGWSGINAAAIMVDRAHAARTNGHITHVHLMDIKAAFPSVANR